LARNPRQLRRRRPVPGALLRRRQRRGGFEGQHLHGRDLRRETRAEVRHEGAITMRRNLYIGSTLVALVSVLGIGQGVLEKQAEAQAKAGAKVQVPRFEVDPTFPKPLPNHWYQGMSIGVGVDANDHIWIVHRPDTVNANEAAEDAKTGACCAKAP